MNGVLLLATEAGGGAAAHGSFTWPIATLSIVLLGLNAFFVAAEIALLAARQGRIEERAEAGDARAKIALNALRELSITFSGAQLGITMASLGLGAIAEPAVAGLIDTWLSGTPLPEGPRGAIAFALGLSIVVFLHMVVGEMLPKNLALADAEAVSLRLARPFRWFIIVLRPLILLLNTLGNLAARAVGVTPRDEIGLVHTPDELALVLRESRRHGTLAPQDERVLSAALGLHGLDAETAMTPRVDLVSVTAQMTGAQVLDLAAETGFTRFPVQGDDLDDIVGLVNVKDVLIRDDTDPTEFIVEDVLRPIGAVPESRDLEGLLSDMRRTRSHAVLVVDEYGGTAGMLSLEDIIEELVGEIDDEFDANDPNVSHRSEGRWVLNGSMRREEVARVTGLTLDESESETLSGWLTEQVGRLLETGDEADHRGWHLTVQNLDGRRAGDVEITAPPPDPQDPTDPTDPTDEPTPPL